MALRPLPPKSGALKSGASNVGEFTVSELAGSLKRTVEDAYGHVRLRGEISGFRGPHGSGHSYFSLKDERAVIDAIVWKGKYAGLKAYLAEGLEVIATGKVTTYPGRSKYQIVVEALEPAGEGALMALLEARKKKLMAEGLFAPEAKRALPAMPRTIGVVTSPTGAVIRDILHRLADRFVERVIVWPVRVQGEGAAAEIARAIRGFDAEPPVDADGVDLWPRPDLIIVARGGGSLEDLWCFNEESVVRAAFEATTPLISAVGHETDTTLIDFASDRRAPTPTAAAEIAAPLRIDLAEAVSRAGAAQARAVHVGVERARAALTSSSRGLGRAEDVLADPRRRLDAVAEDLPRVAERNVKDAAARLERASLRLAARTPAAALDLMRRRLDAAAQRLSPDLALRPVGLRRERLNDRTVRLAAAAGRDARVRRDALDRGAARLTPRLVDPLIKRADARVGELASRALRAHAVRLDRRRDGLEAAAQLLKALSYQSVLDRGFALVRGGDDAPLTRAAKIEAGAGLSLQFADGRVSAVAGGTAAPRPKAVRKPAHAATAPSLFD